LLTVTGAAGAGSALPPVAHAVASQEKAIPTVFLGLPTCLGRLRCIIPRFHFEQLLITS
jgi:hypothetical protein